MRGNQGSTKPYIITKPRAVYEAYQLYLEGHAEFSHKDIMDRTGVDVYHVSGTMSSCIRFGYMLKVSSKRGNWALYKLTKWGLDRGALFNTQYNPITGLFRDQEPATSDMKVD